jgi:hypothetical protein
LQSVNLSSQNVGFKIFPFDTVVQLFIPIAHHTGVQKGFTYSGIKIYDCPAIFNTLRMIGNSMKISFTGIF